MTAQRSDFVDESGVSEHQVASTGFLVLIFSMNFAALVIAGPLEDGTAACNHGDVAAALRFWRPLADQDNAVAQFKLGTLYAEGLGVRQDYVEASKWHLKAADDAVNSRDTLRAWRDAFSGRARRCVCGEKSF